MFFFSFDLIFEACFPWIFHVIDVFFIGLVGRLVIFIRLALLIFIRGFLVSLPIINVISILDFYGVFQPFIPCDIIVLLPKLNFLF